MSRPADYIMSNEDKVSLSDLHGEEQLLVIVLRWKAEASQDQNDFDNYWMKWVSEFYLAKGLTHREIQRTKAYQIARDLSQRVGMRLGVTRPPDYRSQLAELIRTKFISRKAFCEATGLSEDMVSHVLAGRKHLSLPSLEEALGRIGYVLRFVPNPTQAGRDKDVS
jgi:hypothetical protein